MEKSIAGFAVFLAVVCGQPDILAILCLFLIGAIVLGIISSTALRHARAI